MPRATTLLAAAILLAALPAAAADPPFPATELNAEAKKQYRLGSDALAAQRYVEAALHFETATSKNPHAVSWYMAATAWEKASRPERAADALARALDVPGLSPDLGEKIKTQLANLEASLGTVVLNGAQSYRASLDGGSAVAPPARLHGLPGNHVITILPPDHAPYRRERMLLTGETTLVTLGEGEEEGPLAPPPPPAPPRVELRYVTREVPRPAEPRRYVGFGLLGGGVAALAATAVLGLATLDARDEYRASGGVGAYDHARDLQHWTNASLVVGGALVAAGAALVLWPATPRARTTARVGPGGVVLGGAF